jgi:hypothetical protein
VEPGAELLRTWIAEETRRLKGGKPARTHD